MAETPDLGKMWKQLTDTVGGNVSEVFNKLKKSNISEHMQSWIGKGENKPVTANQMTQALGQEHMQRIAQQTGTTPEQAAQKMADKLPGMVDKMSPDGQLPDPQTIKQNIASMPTGATNAMGSTPTSATRPTTNPPPM